LRPAFRHQQKLVGDGAQQVPVVRLDHANASDSEWHEVNLDNAVADADLDEALSTGAASSLPPRTPGAISVTAD